MQGKIKMAEIGRKRASRIYIKLANASIWFRDFSSPEAAEEALRVLDDYLTEGKKIPLKQWSRIPEQEKFRNLSHQEQVAACLAAAGVY